MGAKPNFSIQRHRGFLCLTLSAGNDGYHKGAQFGPVHSSEAAEGVPAKYMAGIATIKSYHACVDLCFDVRTGAKPLADLDAWMSAQTATWSTAPFGGSLAALWAGLTTAEKTGGTVDGVSLIGFVATILIAALDEVVCA